MIKIHETEQRLKLHLKALTDTMEKLDYRFMAELVESLVLFFTSQH